jgi:hypothetical protein
MSRDLMRKRRSSERGKVVLRVPLAVGVALALAPLAAISPWRSPVLTPRGDQAQKPPVIAVTLEALSTPRSGATGRFKASVGRNVAVGDRVVEGFTVGGDDGTDLCDVGTMPAGEGGGGRLQWRVEAAVESADTGSATVALTWQRSVIDTTTSARAIVASDQRAVRLQPDDVHVLDLVQAEAGSRSACANVLLRVRAARAGTPAIARTWLTYDLWLIYEGAGGEHATRHLRLAGPDETPLTADFAPLRWGLDRRFVGEAAQAAVQVAVRGTVQGSCRPDGAVEVVLDSRRSAVLGGVGVMGSGRKRFVLASSDEVAVELPNPTATLTAGWETLARYAQPWAPGVRGSADAVTVDLGEFFRESRFRVLVGARCD